MCQAGKTKQRSSQRMWFGPNSTEVTSSLSWFSLLSPLFVSRTTVSALFALLSVSDWVALHLSPLTFPHAALQTLANLLTCLRRLKGNDLLSLLSRCSYGLMIARGDMCAGKIFQTYRLHLAEGEHVSLTCCGTWETALLILLDGFACHQSVQLWLVLTAQISDCHNSPGHKAMANSTCDSIHLVFTKPA